MRGLEALLEFSLTVRSRDHLSALAKSVPVEVVV